MKFIPTKIKDVIIIEPDVYRDSRGYFLESFNQKRYTDAGIDRTFVQDNLSFSVKNTLRGLHYQIRHPQAKLVQVLRGAIFDVAVDLRRTSPTFGDWIGIQLSDTNNRQLFVPEGFAHGFCVLSDSAYFSYKCSDFYLPQDEHGILWSDPQLNIDWPTSAPLLSAKDLQCQTLANTTSKHLPQ